MLNILFFNSGYMAPEYAMDGLFSMKSDTYSFGVILLEISSGKKNSGLYSAHRSFPKPSISCSLLFLHLYVVIYLYFSHYEDLDYFANRHGRCGMKTRDLNL